MSKINCAVEFMALMRYCRRNGVPPREKVLMMSLLYIANKLAKKTPEGDYEWPDGYIPITNAELSDYSVLDKRTIERVRECVKQRGLIDFVPGVKGVRPAGYKINYLTNTDLRDDSFATSLQQTCSKDAASVLQACSKNAANVQQACSKDAAKVSPFLGNSNRNPNGNPNNNGKGKGDGSLWLIDPDEDDGGW